MIAAFKSPFVRRLLAGFSLGTMGVLLLNVDQLSGIVF